VDLAAAAGAVRPGDRDANADAKQRPASFGEHRAHVGAERGVGAAWSRRRAEREQVEQPLNTTERRAGLQAAGGGAQPRLRPGCNRRRDDLDECALARVEPGQLAEQQAQRPATLGQAEWKAVGTRERQLGGREPGRLLEWLRLGGAAAARTRPGRLDRPLNQRDRNRAREPEPEASLAALGGELEGDLRLPKEEPSKPRTQQIVKCPPQQRRALSVAGRRQADLKQPRAIAVAASTGPCKQDQRSREHDGAARHEGQGVQNREQR
jgi:hypothetical protein